MQPAAYLFAWDNSEPHVWHSLVSQSLSIWFHAYFTDIESSDSSSSSRHYAQQGSKRNCNLLYTYIVLNI